MQQSPFGQYAAPLAAAVAAAVVGVWLIVAATAGANTQTLDRLTPFATLALGAVFGSAAATNGYKLPLSRAHTRIDQLQAAVDLTAAKALEPVDAAAVTSLLIDNRPTDTADPLPPPQ